MAALFRAFSLLCGLLPLGAAGNFIVQANETRNEWLFLTPILEISNQEY